MCYIAHIHGAGMSSNMRVVKIGHSQNPSLRFQQLCAMGWLAPGWIEATTTRDDVRGSEIELFMHERLWRERVHHEWFHVDANTLALVKNEVSNAFGVDWCLDNVSDIENEIGNGASA